MQHSATFVAHILLMLLCVLAISTEDINTESDILDPRNDIFRIIVQGSPPKRYDIFWKSLGLHSKIKRSLFPALWKSANRISSNLNEWNYHHTYSPMGHTFVNNGSLKFIPKTFVILYGDSNERNALEMTFNTSCDIIFNQHRCCDIEEMNKINVTFCNIFTFGVDANLTIQSRMRWNINKHLDDNDTINYKQRTQKSIKYWNIRYGVNISDKCTSNEWKCYVIFQSVLWDISRDLNEMQLYEERLLNLYKYIKYDGLRFVGNNIIWRDAPIPTRWGSMHRNLDYDLEELNVYNHIGFRLFEERMKRHEMRIFKWTNFVPVAVSCNLRDLHHWNCDYNDLYLGLIYRFTTLPKFVNIVDKNQHNKIIDNVYGKISIAGCNELCFQNTPRILLVSAMCVILSLIVIMIYFILQKMCQLFKTDASSNE